MSLTGTIAGILDDAFIVPPRLRDRLSCRIQAEARGTNQAAPSIEDILADELSPGLVDNEQGRLAVFRIALAIEMAERPIAPLRKRVAVPA